MQRKNRSSASSSGDTSAGNQPLDVADVPDAILEAISIARRLGNDEGKQIVALLRPVLGTMAAAAEQLAEVA